MTPPFHLMNNFVNNTAWMNYVPAWNPSAIWGGNSSNSSIMTCKTQREYEQQQLEKTKDKAQKLSQLNQEKVALQQAKLELEAQEKKLKQGKLSDGSAVVKQEPGKEFKKWTIGDKIGKYFMNSMCSIGNVLKSLVGFDKEGKFNIWKCVRNVAIGVAIGVACVYAAPVAVALFGKGMLATAVASIPTVATKAGLVYGTGKWAYETYNTFNAKTEEEFNDASNSAGEAAFLAVTSKLGLRSMNKAAGVQVAAPKGIVSSILDFTSPIPVQKADYALLFSNAAARNNVAQSATYLAQNGGGWKGFLATCKQVRKDSWNQAGKDAKEKFEVQKDKLQTSVEQSRDNALRKLGSSTSAEENAMAQFELDMQSHNLKRLSLARNKDDWSALVKINDRYTKLLKIYKNKIKTGKDVTINGQKFTPTQLKSYVANLAKQQKAFNSQLKSLKQERFSSMLTMSRRKAFEQEVKDFGFSTTCKLVNPKNLVQGYYGKGAFSPGSLFMGGLMLMDPVYALQPTVSGASWGTPMVALAAADPTREILDGEKMTAEQVKAAEETLAANKLKIKEQEELHKAMLKEIYSA